MANYSCTIRTNYFHVTDEEGFEAFMGTVHSSEGDVELWKKKDADKTTVYGFGCEGGISGVKNAKADEDDDADESAYDEFISGLQKFICEGDAVILMETGHEKLCYVCGIATIVTRNNYKTLDIITLAQKKAAELLGNPEFQTQCDY